MKKSIAFIAMIAFATMAFAQTNTNARRTVIVGEVTGKSANVVKYNIIYGLSTTTRVNIYDSRQYGKLPKEMRDAIHIDAIFNANVDSLVTRKVKTGTNDKNGNPETKWVSHCYVTLKVIDPKTSATLKTTSISGYGSNLQKAAEAEDAATMTICNDLNSFVDEYWPVHGEILTLNEVSGNKAKTVTINLGSNSSVYGNMQFSVFNPANEKIGELQMKEISSSDKSVCKVTKGGGEIKTAIENDARLRIVSHKLDIVSDLITIEKKTSAIVSEPKSDCNKIHTVLYTGAVGNKTTNSVIDQRIEKELTKSNRIYFLTLDQYNALNPDKRATLVIDGLLTATAGNCRTERESRESYTSYTTKADWMLLLTDAMTGEILYSENSIGTGLSTESEAKSIEKAVNHASVPIDYIIDKAYPIYTTISTVDEFKKNKAKSVTIEVGSKSPVYEGMKLQVYILNAENEWTAIGELKVKEIMGENQSSCTVSDGGAEIMAASEAGTITRVVTKAKSLLGGLLKL